MPPTIRVLIADDTFIGRKGLHQSLEDVPDIEIVGEVDALGLLSSQLDELAPHVLILDLNWHGNEDAGLDYITKIKADKTTLPILAITAYDRLFHPSRAAGADAVSSKNVSPVELRTLVRDLAARKPHPDYPNRSLAQQCEMFIRRLKATPPGHEGARLFEEVVADILVFLLAPHVTRPHPQSENASGTQVRDLILENRGGHSFWDLMRDQYGASFVVVEIKNTRELEEGHVRQMQDYLKPPLGKLGLIVSRSEPGTRIPIRQREAYQNHQCIVLVLAEKDLVTMLDLKARGENPLAVIEQKYSELVLSL